MLCYVCYIRRDVCVMLCSITCQVMLCYLLCYVIEHIIFILYNMLCCVMFMLRCRTCYVCYVIITCYIYVT